MTERPSFTKSFWSWPNNFWNLILTLSGLGIWPRFIEPNLLFHKKITLPVSDLRSRLKIVLFSDLHIQPLLPSSFLKRIQQKILSQNADLILFTGDFFCQSVPLCQKRLIDFLTPLEGRLGSFAVLGNHDYSSYVAINKKGDYGLKKSTQDSPIKEGLRRLLYPPPKLTGKMDNSLKGIKPHPELEEILSQTPFQLLRNESVAFDEFNLIGLGEYSANDLDLQKAFSNLNPALSNIVMAHNPDTLPQLSDYRVDLQLSGHTHGGQINLPYLWRRFGRIENPKFKVGLIKKGETNLYVTRGLGAILPMRLFSPPEIVTITLEPS